MTAANPHALAQKAASAWYEGQTDVAELLMRRLLKEAPDFPVGHYLFAGLLLSKGRWPEAWPHFERRLGLPIYDGYRSLMRQLPLWRGEPVPAGARLLLIGDMGYGDIIMCTRFLPQVAARFAQVHFLMPNGLKCLIDGQFPGVVTAEFGAPLPPASHLGLTFSLPAALNLTPAGLTGRPYLHADPELADAWRQRLGAGFKVGLVWAGSKQHPSDGERSLRAAQLAPLLAVPGVRFVSLQRDAAVADLDTIASMGGDFTHDPGMTASFADMAAVMQSLDLIVTVDTAPAHLAGALGRPVWIAVQFTADWRWMSGRSDSPWYGSARLFRAARRHGLDSAVDAMAQALAGVAQTVGQGVDRP